MFVITHENVRLAVNEPSETFAVTVNVPALVYDGVPEISPVAWLIDSPAGRPLALKVTGVPSGSDADNATDTAVPSALVWFAG